MAFKFSQTNGLHTESAALSVPGHSTNGGDVTPIVRVDKEEGDVFYLYVWADINSKDFTHRIDLSDAKISNREKVKPKSKALPITEKPVYPDVLTDR